MDLGVLYKVMNTFEPKNLGPLAQKFNFAQSELHAFLKIAQLASIITLSIFVI